MKSWTVETPKDLLPIIDAFEDEIKRLMKAASMDFWQKVMISTPVDTGYARYGWFISSHAPSNYLPPDGQKKYPMPQIQDHMDIRPYSIHEKLYVTSNVPYIGKLNSGSSTQAPANFVEMAAAKVQNTIATKAKSIK